MEVYWAPLNDWTSVIVDDSLGKTQAIRSKERVVIGMRNIVAKSEKAVSWWWIHELECWQGPKRTWFFRKFYTSLDAEFTQCASMLQAM